MDSFSRLLLSMLRYSVTMSRTISAAVVDEWLYNISLSVAVSANLYVLQCISQSVVIAYIIRDLFLFGVPVVVAVEGSCQNPVTIVIEREHIGVVADAFQFGRVELLEE